MTHRLGPMVTLDTPFEIGPDTGRAPTSEDMWERSFSPDPPPGGTKFLLLHFTDLDLPGDNRLEIQHDYGKDVFTSTSGPDAYTRPVEGGSVTVRYFDDGTGTPSGSATLTRYGRGEALRDGGETNANGDIFLLDSPYQDPSYANPDGLCMDRSWENVACLPGGLERETARSVGMLVMEHHGNVSSCSAALIDEDLILTAAHCMPSDTESDSASITFDFRTECDGTPPAGYDPHFHKVKRVVQHGAAERPDEKTLDYAILQIETPPDGLGLSPLELREDVPDPGESLFAIHHPRGAVKKISHQPDDPKCFVSTDSTPERIKFGCDLDNGSSGSPLFDSSGLIVGVNNWPGGCSNGAQGSSAILEHFLSDPPPETDVDAMLVLDRSGSMSLPGKEGRPKIEEARDAATLFVDLVRLGEGHQAGLASFSSSADVNVDLESVTSGHKERLRGMDGIEGLTPGGLTSIGGGLEAALSEFPTPTPDTNTRAILLLTDGLQNTPPMIADVESRLEGSHLCIVGYGTDASLDGPLLTRLAREHGGNYTRAGDGLGLKKFFTLCFGNIFASGSSLDPEYVLPEGADAAEPVPVEVCGEAGLTVVIGWERPEVDLQLELETPEGTTITDTTAGVEAASGETWAFLRLGLPHGGERDGTWQAHVSRIGQGEFDPEEAERFFLSTVVDGGPKLRLANPGEQDYYTGDTINPAVVLRRPDGGWVDADVTVEVTSPEEGTGNLLVEADLGDADTVDGDRLDARTSTLRHLEEERSGTLVPTTERIIPLYDDGEHDDGAMEPDGIYGNPIDDLARVEGSYTFRARATFGDQCTATRELAWSTYVAVGIDPDATEVETEVIETFPDGRERVRINVTPRDRFGNYLGPGRLGTFDVEPQAGAEPVGGLLDEGDGSYVQDVRWDPDAGAEPGVTIVQPGRKPSMICPPPADEGETNGGAADRWRRRFWIVLLLVVLLVVLLMAVVL